MPDPINPPASTWDQAEMPVTEHLRELRTRLIRSLIATVLFALVLIWPSAFVIKLLVATYFPGQILHAFGPTDVVAAQIKFSLFGGLILGLPFSLAQLWFFIVPALDPRTRKLVYIYTLPSLALAGGGLAFCHFFVLPRVAGALLMMTGEVAEPTFGIGPTLNLIFGLFFAFALIFQTPVVMMALARIGLINVPMLRKFRRHIFMGCLVAGGVAAPDGSPLTMLMLALPLYILFESGILVILAFERTVIRKTLSGK